MELLECVHGYQLDESMPLDCNACWADEYPELAEYRRRLLGSVS